MIIMKKEDLRKVYYDDYEGNELDKKGYFHCLGPKYIENYDAIVIVAFVENKELGHIVVVPTDQIRFVDRWNDEKLPEKPLGIKALS